VKVAGQQRELDVFDVDHVLDGISVMITMAVMLFLLEINAVLKHFLRHFIIHGHGPGQLLGGRQKSSTPFLMHNFFAIFFI
jgi:hypothetical protein